MEYSLRLIPLSTNSSKAVGVLILILMEYSLRHLPNGWYDDNGTCLNPYSNGI